MFDTKMVKWQHSNVTNLKIGEFPSFRFTSYKKWWRPNDLNDYKRKSKWAKTRKLKLIRNGGIQNNFLLSLDFVFRFRLFSGDNKIVSSGVGRRPSRPFSSARRCQRLARWVNLLRVPARGRTLPEWNPLFRCFVLGIDKAKVDHFITCLPRGIDTGLTVRIFGQFFGRFALVIKWRLVLQKGVRVDVLYL